MKQIKKYYYVVVEGKVVYGIDNGRHSVYWSDPKAMPKDRKPLAMTKTIAENICEGLLINFFNAHIEIYYSAMPYCTKDSEKENGEE